MMCTVKQAVLLLLLGVVVSNADPEDCEALTKRRPTTELDKIFGEWVLVWSVGDQQKITDVLKNTTSSHVHFRLLSDNQTIVFHERNVYLSNTSSCTTYVINTTVKADAENLTLVVGDSTLDVDGVFQVYNESGEVDVYSSSADSLQIVYKEQDGRFLLNYRREGSHRDVDEHKTAHDFLKKHAECLKFPSQEPFVYDGVADFCHKKSAPEAKPEES
ncbi:unnamed protein product [Ophioblennius macclurei]